MASALAPLPSLPNHLPPSPHPRPRSPTDTTGAPAWPQPVPVPSELPDAQGWSCPWLPCSQLGWWDGPWLRDPAVPGTSVGSHLPSPQGATNPHVTLVACAHNSTEGVCAHPAATAAGETGGLQAVSIQLPDLVPMNSSESNLVSLCPQTLHTTAPAQFLPRISAPNYTSKKRTNSEAQRFIGYKIIWSSPRRVITEFSVILQGTWAVKADRLLSMDITEEKIMAQTSSLNSRKHFSF